MCVCVLCRISIITVVTLKKAFVSLLAFLLFSTRPTEQLFTARRLHLFALCYPDDTNARDNMFSGMKVCWREQIYNITLNIILNKSPVGGHIH